MDAELERLEQALQDKTPGAWPAREDTGPQEEVPPAGEPGSATLRAHARDCAAIPGPGEAAEVPSPVSLGTWLASLTPVRRATAARARAAELSARRDALLSEEFGPAYRRHRECAEHYRSPLAGGLRMLYGYLHMALVQGPVDYFKWATASPLSLVIHVLIGLAVWLSLLLGGYL